ncbi:MAG: hypothetical protein Q4B30_06100, partial [Coriobacteriaceae bacterium]|nr:hypothetical protein [Coriobacteriaceae bacterium]
RAIFLSEAISALLRTLVTLAISTGHTFYHSSNVAQTPAAREENGKRAWGFREEILLSARDHEHATTQRAGHGRKANN